MSLERIEIYIALVTASVSILGVVGAWVVALDNRLDLLDSQIYRLTSVVLSADFQCDLDYRRYLEGPSNAD